MSGSRFMEHALILVVEVTAMRDGIEAALHVYLRRIEVEGNNHIAIKAKQRQISTP